MEGPRFDNDAKYDKSFMLNVDDIVPQVTWGTNPSMTIDVTSTIPNPDEYAKGNEEEKKSAIRALKYMDLTPGLPITNLSSR